MKNSASNEFLIALDIFFNFEVNFSIVPTFQKDAIVLVYISTRASRLFGQKN